MVALKKLLLATGLLLFVFILAVVAWYYYYSVQKSPPTSINNKLYYSKVAEDIFVAVESFRNDGATDEEFLRFTEEQVRQLDMDTLYPIDRAWMELLLARAKEKIDRDAALLGYAKVYNKPEYEQLWTVRGSALASAMLYATEVGSPRLSLAEAKELIFKPDLFGRAVGIDSIDELNQIETEEELRLLVGIGLEKASPNILSKAREMRLEVESLLLQSGTILERLYNSNDSVEFTSTEATSHLNEHLELHAQYDSIKERADALNAAIPIVISDRSIYSSEVLYTLNYLQRLYTQLLFVGYDVMPSILNMHEYLSVYINLHGNEHEFALERTNIIRASSDYRLVCALILVNQQEGGDTNKLSAENVLLKSLYDLSEDELRANGSLLIDAAKRPYYPCHQAFLTLGRENQRFADFLVKNVGGWSYEQFTSPKTN
ncbi:hypothetical protein H6783_01330 [Candidatus Nomurabacteria bacterium]|nr:hypothetical protein [Candidatus Nomurabacteria bacterium]